MKSYKEILPNIKVFMFDVDGVFTDGNVILMGGDVVRILNSRDGYAVQYAAKLEYPIFIVTGGKSEDVKLRLENLGATKVFLGSANKLKVFNTILEEYHIKAEEVLYMGDDIPDIQVMEKAGVAACPSDASVEAKSVSQYISPYPGGKHCVRDVIEQTLRVQGKWMGEKALEW